jgi:hypothetical protein
MHFTICTHFNQCLIQNKIFKNDFYSLKNQIRVRLLDAHVIHIKSLHTNSAVVAVVVEIGQNVIKQNRLKIFF